MIGTGGMERSARIMIHEVGTDTFLGCVSRWLIRPVQTMVHRRDAEQCHDHDHDHDHRIEQTEDARRIPDHHPEACQTDSEAAQRTEPQTEMGVQPAMKSKVVDPGARATKTKWKA